MRNVVLITWDSVRADHYSCYGYGRKTTPFLDRLAERGLKFENAIVSGVPTPISMGGILTGQHFELNQKITTTIATVLRYRDYKTAAFHTNPFVSRYYGFNKGFDIFRDCICDQKRGNKFVNKFINYINAAKYVFLDRDVARIEFKKYYRDIVDLAHSSDNYFIWILMIDTHFPYTPPNINFIEKIKVLRIYNKIYKGGGIYTRINANIDVQSKQRIINAYDGEIQYVDSLTEQLWNDIKDTDPIFILHADHGEAFGEHGFFGHPPEHYEYLIRVPLVIYNADVKGVVKEPVSLLRLAPTICELAGVKNAKNEFSQPSLLEEVEYTPPIVENKLKGGYRVTVRDVEWKLIVNPDRGDELYNIRKDPMEQNNLIGYEKDIERELRALAEKHLKTRIIQGRIGDSVRALKRLRKI